MSYAARRLFLASRGEREPLRLWGYVPLARLVEGKKAIQEPLEIKGGLQALPTNFRSC